MTRKRKLTSIVLCAALALVPLTGCTKKEEAPDKEVPMGRYVEETWELPIESNRMTALHQRPDGRFGILLSDPQDEYKQSYYSTTDGTDWREDPPEWLADIMSSGGFITDINYNSGGEAAVLHYPDSDYSQGNKIVIIDTGGTPTRSPLGDEGDPWEDDWPYERLNFALSTDDGESGEDDSEDDPGPDGQEGDAGGDDPEKTQLAEAVAEARLANLDPDGQPDSEEKQEVTVVTGSGRAVYFDNVWLRDDGLLYASSSAGVGLFAPDTGETIRKFYNQPVAATVSGDQLVELIHPSSALWNPDLDITVPTLYFFDSDTGVRTREHPSEILFSGQSQLAVDAQGTLYAAHATGVYRLVSGGEMWEQVINGDMCSLSLPSLETNAFLPHGDNEFLILYASMDQSQLCNYVYSADTPTLPDVELTVYELQHNQFLPQAIGAFRKDHPNVLVTVRSASDGDEGMKGDDFLRVLNTELLAGNGPDLLLLDYMPVESYIEKGVLADLSDILDPLVDAGDILDNIAGVYRQDGKAYAIPTRFSALTLWGARDAVAAADSLESLIDYAGANPNERVFFDMSPQLLLHTFGSTFQQQLIRDGNVDVDKVEWLFTKIKELADTSGGDYYPGEDPSTYNESWDTLLSSYSNGGSHLNQGQMEMAAGNSRLAFALLNGYTSLLAPNGAAYYANGGTTVSGDASDGVYTTVPDAQVSDVFRPVPSEGRQVFVPSSIIGVNADGKQQELARDFVRIMLSEAAQNSDLSNGFSVNRRTIDKMRGETKPMVLAVANFDSESGASTYLQMNWPSEAMLGALSELFATLDTPADLEFPMGEMIDAARPFFEGSATPREAAEDFAQRMRIQYAE